MNNCKKIKSWELHLLLIYVFLEPEHENSLESKHVLISGKMTWKKTEYIPNFFTQKRPTNISNKETWSNRTPFPPYTCF